MKKILTLNYKVLFMESELNYIRDLTEIRSMMERSTRFLSLSGWSGILAGIYALLGVTLVYTLFNPELDPGTFGVLNLPEKSSLLPLVLLAAGILILALSTAIFLSIRKSKEKGAKLWTATAQRLVMHMAIPLVSGGIFLLILLSKGLIGLMAPVTLLFYGLALINASKFTYEEVKYLGLFQIALGLLATCFIVYGLLFWALGFGVMHIIYGIYMYQKYEK